MRCILCKSIISQLNSRRRKYCSTKCIKKAWYLRYLKRNSNIKSYFTNNPNFWKTETGIAFKWEKYAAKLLGAKHLEFNVGIGDLDWNGKIIDVKVCNLYKRKNKRGKLVKKSSGWWVFNRNKMKSLDFFFCICLIDDKPHKMFLIPSTIFPSKGATIGQKSDKYDKYIYPKISS